MLFTPFMSAVEASFWYRLSRLKLEKYKLSTDPQPVIAAYSAGIPASVAGTDGSETAAADGALPALMSLSSEFSFPEESDSMPMLAHAERKQELEAESTTRYASYCITLVAPHHRAMIDLVSGVLVVYFLLVICSYA